MPIPRRALWCIACLCLAAGVWVQLAHSQNFSEWTQASGVTQVEYRWKRNDVKGCDVEYRDQQERGRKKYKTRIVFQTDGDERKQTNAILSFNEGVANASDHVQTCNLITDVTVTRF